MEWGADILNIVNRWRCSTKNLCCENIKEFFFNWIVFFNKFQSKTKTKEEPKLRRKLEITAGWWKRIVKNFGSFRCLFCCSRHWFKSQKELGYLDGLLLMSLKEVLQHFTDWTFKESSQVLSMKHYKKWLLNFWL